MRGGGAGCWGDVWSACVYGGRWRRLWRALAARAGARSPRVRQQSCRRGCVCSERQAGRPGPPRPSNWVPLGPAAGAARNRRLRHTAQGSQRRVTFLPQLERQPKAHGTGLQTRRDPPKRPPRHTRADAAAGVSAAGGRVLGQPGRPSAAPIGGPSGTPGLGAGKTGAAGLRVRAAPRRAAPRFARAWLSSADRKGAAVRARARRGRGVSCRPGNGGGQGVSCRGAHPEGSSVGVKRC